MLADFYLDALRRAGGANLPPINEDQPEGGEAADVSVDLLRGVGEAVVAQGRIVDGRFVEGQRPVQVAGGHEIVGEAGNGIEAIAQFQELRPDVMTLDITMPEKDGLAALKEIIAIDPNAKIVMCSALGQESKVLEAVKSGAKDFVVKPFQPDRVLSAINKAVA